MRKRRPTVDHRHYYSDRLAEPWLLERALLLDVEANEEPLAVPVGELRRGGHIEFLDREEARKGLEMLRGRDGFPRARIIEYAEEEKAADYFEVRWGAPPPFDGCDYSDPICGLLLGIHYGYKDEALAEMLSERFERLRGPFSNEAIVALIRSARNPR